MSLKMKALVALCAVACSSSLYAQELKVYGAGGPAPAFKAAVAQFEKDTGVKVAFVAGPTSAWIAAAKEDADVLFSGSENMMSDFAAALGPQVDPAQAEPLYMRPMVLVVRPGNPKHIGGFEDLFKPGVKVEVVNGSGLSGVWEDMAGRDGNIGHLRALRHNIVSYAKNSGEAKQIWSEHADIDVWLTWNIWQAGNQQLGEVVKIEPRYALFRDTGVVITQKGHAHPAAARLLDYLKSPSGAAFFEAKGWLTN